MSQHYQTDIYSHEESVLSRNKVLRQTYILLSATVLFSALCAYIGMLLNMPAMPWSITLIGLIALSFAITANRNSGLGILFLFMLTGFLGLSLSAALNAYVAIGMGDVIVKAMIGSGIIFMSLSLYVLKTGKDFTFLGGFLFVAMIVVFLAAIGAVFFHMTALSVAASAAFLLIFSGYVLYDTSNIVNGYETNYIVATLNLFINLFNIFVSLLNLLGVFRD